MQGNTLDSRRNAKSGKAVTITIYFITGLIIISVNAGLLNARGKKSKKSPKAHVSKIHNSSPGLANPVNLDNYDSGISDIKVENGYASCYGKKFNNRRTSSGEIHLSEGYTAAHRRAAFGTIFRITNLSNNKSTLVRVNDRGPFVRSRIVDISYTAASDIDGVGTPRVRIESFNPVEEKFLGNSGHYFCYSLIYPLVSLDRSSLQMVDSTADFNEAIDIYRQLDSSEKDRYAFIAVKADEGKQKKPLYYIALFNPADEIIIEEEVAKDILNGLNFK